MGKVKDELCPNDYKMKFSGFGEENRTVELVHKEYKHHIGKIILGSKFQGMIYQLVDAKDLYG